MDEYQKEINERYYFNQRKPDRLYVSKEFRDRYTGNKKRFIYKIHNSEKQVKFVKKKKEIVLSETRGGRYQLKALIIEENRNITTLIIQSFTQATGSPHQKVFSFRNDEIDNLYTFLKGIKELSFETSESFAVDDERLEQILLNQQQASKIILENEEIVSEALKNNITQSDIVAIGYRKNQLEKFEKLLQDEIYFEEEKRRIGTSSDEKYGKLSSKKILGSLDTDSVLLLILHLIIKSLNKSHLDITLIMVVKG